MARSGVEDVVERQDIACPRRFAGSGRARPPAMAVLRCRAMSLSPAHLAELRALLGEDGVLDTHAARFTYEADAHALERHLPDVVVLPRGTDQVAAILRWARARRIPVTPRGAGTGLTGGCAPERGGIVLSVNRMDRVIRVDEDSMFAWVQPGLVNLWLSQQLASRKLTYAPDPASQQVSTIG